MLALILPLEPNSDLIHNANKPIAHPLTEKRSVFCRKYDRLKEWERGERRSAFFGEVRSFFGEVRSVFGKCDRP